MSFESAVSAKAIELDHLVLDMIADSGSGHPSTALSLGQIVTVLMYHTMRWVPDHPRYPTSDRLVLSEGHAVPIVYAACADLGVAIGTDPDQMRPMTREDAMQIRAIDSEIEGHPNPVEGFPLFDAATGSLGQGLSVAMGLGAAARGDSLDKRIYCIVGDGESREGQIWEAIDFMADHSLSNVLPIFNCNEYGQADRVSPQQSAERIAAKLAAYGLTVIEIDGHDPAQIRDAFNEAATTAQDGTLTAIVARTVKGWGAPCIQGPGWHGKPVTGELLEEAHEQLDAIRSELVTTQAGDELAIYPPTEFEQPERPAFTPPTLDQALEQFGKSSVLQKGMFATRHAFGIALHTMARSERDIWVLDADTGNSTFTEWAASDEQVSDRFLECKIAEQNMFSVGAGLSAAGKVPFMATFSKFVTRGYDQIEMAINSGANLKIVGSHSGISLAADGPSQMSLPDIAWFRSFATMKDHNGQPGCYVLQPSDAYAAYALTMAMAEHDGACYMRVHRPDVEFLYDSSASFELGGFEVLTTGRDLLIVTAGYMVHECNKALDALDKAGIDATLVDLYSLPFEADGLLDLANSNGGNILTVEDNYGASLGSAVADACTESGDGFTIQQMHVRRVPKSGRAPDEVLRHCGIHHRDIAATAASMLGLANV